MYWADFGYIYRGQMVCFYKALGALRGKFRGKLRKLRRGGCLYKILSAFADQGLKIGI